MRSGPRTHGRRVVEGQQLMQAASDVLLGHLRTTRTLDGQTRDFYVRQLWDSKASFDVTRMSPPTLGQYAEVCGWTLARAHARSGDPVAISAYLGRGDVFDRAITDFARRYTEQNERDYETFVDAVRSGALEAVEGL